MIAFLDTSVLVKLYHKEKNSDIVLRNLSSAKEIYLSEIAKLEFISALFKKVRTKEIDEDKAKVVVSLFEDDLSKFKWILIDSLLIRRAAGLLRDFGTKGLRTLDSIQLASALTMRDSDCTFFTTDEVLKKLFVEMNLKTF